MPSEKICCTCGVPKVISEFSVNRSKKDGRCDECRGCHGGYNNDHYANNKAYYIEKAMLHRQRMRAFVASLKTGPCVDCGQTFPPCAMDFDHVRGAKVLGVANLVALGSKDRILAEIAKCDLVCACCHRIRTHGRKDCPPSGTDTTQVSEVCSPSSILGEGAAGGTSAQPSSLQAELAKCDLLCANCHRELQIGSASCRE